MDGVGELFLELRMSLSDGSWMISLMESQVNNGVGQFMSTQN